MPSPYYDPNGNMIQCSLGVSPESWSFTFNAENRIIVAEFASGKLGFIYNYAGRRVEKKVYSGSPGSWTLDSHLKFVYNGYEQIEELDALNSDAILKKRIWGGREKFFAIFYIDHRSSLPEKSLSAYGKNRFFSPKGFSTHLNSSHFLTLDIAMQKV